MQSDTNKDIFKLLSVFFFSADFFQLLFVCLQWRVFYIENTNEVETYGGGDNKEILEDVEANAENPVEDFISCKEYVIMSVPPYESILSAKLAHRCSKVQNKKGGST